MGCSFNGLCPCCSYSTSMMLGMCSSRFAWFAPLVSFLGQAWFYFGFGLFLMSLSSIAPSSADYEGMVCKSLMSIVATNLLARAAAEFMSRAAERAVYMIGTLCFTAVFILTAYSDTSSTNILYTISCPLLGLSLAFLDVSTRQVTADQQIGRRWMYTIISYITKLVAILLSSLYTNYVLHRLNWRISFYLYAAFSFCTLMYVSWFMPNRSFAVEKPIQDCSGKHNQKKIFLMMLIDTFVGGLRWILPLLLLQTVAYSEGPEATDTQFVFSTFIAASCFGGIVRTFCSVRKWNTHVLSYMAAAAVNIIVCFYYPHHKDKISTWNIAVFAGMFGYDLAGPDGVVVDMFGVEYFGSISAVISAWSSIGALAMFYYVCSCNSTSGVDTEASNFQVVGYCNVAVLVSTFYIHACINQRRTFSILHAIPPQAVDLRGSHA